MILGDLRFALRQMARTPLLSGVVIAVIALGIGINAGLLTTLHVYVWRPAPGIPPDAKLARLTATVAPPGGGAAAVPLSYPDIRDLREQRQVFSDVAAWRYTTLPADFGAGAETVLAYYVTDNFFNLLRVAPVAGTGFADGMEVTPVPVAVISHSLWIQHYRGSPAAIGQTVRILNAPFTIVGVAPPRFVGVDARQLGHPTVWIPLGARPLLEPGSGDALDRGYAAFHEGVVRLAPGVGPGDVARLTEVLAARLAREESAPRARAFQAERLTGMEWGDGGTRELIAAMAIVAALIVLITCTNVSALLLGRAVARRREVAVRLALGASRFRIVRQMLTESLAYALGGGLLGLVLYTAAIQIAYATIPGIIYGLDPTPATFLGAAALVLLTTLVFGLAPALHASRAGIGEVIKDSGAHAVRRSRLQAAFVVLQLASSQPVLVVTGLVLVNLRLERQVTERAPASVLTLSADLWQPTVAEAAGSPDAAAVATRVRLERIRQRLREIPGVEFAALAADAGTQWVETPDARGTRVASARLVHVSPDYFAARDVPLVRGRAIGVADDLRGSVAAVVSADLARRIWPGTDPVGQRLIVRSGGADGEQSTALDVIGVASAAPFEEGAASARVFVPLATADLVRAPTVAVRTAGDARPFVPRIRAAIREVEPLAAVGDARTLAERAADARAQAVQANAAAFAVGAAALLLASLGLYAVIALAVAQRTREIGVRLAIGASPGGVVRRFLRDGLRVSAIGLAIGVPVTVAGIRIVQASMVGFAPRMAAVLPAVVLVLLAVAALASWLPARRAGRVDPLIALRSE